MGYGFVLEDNPADFVSLKMGSKGDSEPVKMLAKLGVPLAKPHNIPQDTTELPEELLAQMRVLVADEDELQIIRERQEKAKEGSSANGADKGSWKSTLAFIDWPNELEVFAQPFYHG